MTGGIGFNNTPFDEAYKGLISPIGVVAKTVFARGAPADFAARDKLPWPLLQIIANVLFVGVHAAEHASAGGQRPLKFTGAGV